MRVTRIQLENVRRHHKLDLTFAPGVVCLHGGNGHGKSSVIMAIGYALFNRLSVKQKDFIRRGAKRFSVTVDVEHRGSRFTVIRSSDGLFVFDGDGAQVASGSEHGQYAIHEYLQVDPSVKLSDLWSDAVGVAQGALTAGFGLTKTARINYWAALLHLDVYRRAFEDLLPVARVFRDRKTAASSAATSFQETLDMIPEHMSVEVAKAELQQCEKLLAQVTEHAVQLAGLRDKYLAAQARIAAIEEYVPGLATRIVDAQDAAARLPDMVVLRACILDLESVVVDDPLARLQEQVSRVGRMEMECQQTQRDIARLAGERDTMEGQLTRARIVRVSLLDAEMELQEAERKHASVSVQNQVTQARGDECAKRIHVLTHPGDDDATCPVCEMPLTLERRKELLDDAVLELSVIEVERKALLGEQLVNLAAREQAKRERDMLKEELLVLATPEMCEERVIQVGLARAVLSEQAKEFEVAKREQVHMEGLYTDFREKKEVLEQLRLEHMQAEHDKEKGDKLLALLDERIGMRQELNALREVHFDSDAYDAHMSRREQLQHDVAQLVQRVVNATHVESLQVKVAEETQIVQVASAAFALVTSARNTIRDAGPMLTELKMLALIQAARANYEQLQQSPDHLFWTGDFEAGLGDRPFNLLSGGERVGVALSLRLAIAQLEADLSFLVLDEPTIHLDIGARHGLAEMMSRLTLEQTIVVTHDGTFGPYVDQVIEL